MKMRRFPSCLCCCGCVAVVGPHHRPHPGIRAWGPISTRFPGSGCASNESHRKVIENQPFITRVRQRLHKDHVYSSSSSSSDCFLAFLDLVAFFFGFSSSLALPSSLYETLVALRLGRSLATGSALALVFLGLVLATVSWCFLQSANGQTDGWAKSWV
jgi:hypothetical protein